MHTYILWIATLAYALHIIEEYTFDWKKWANSVLKLPVDYTHFAIVNGVVIVLGISCSVVGWNCAMFALSLPALMLINAAFMHVTPFVLTKGRFSPGLFTAVIAFVPTAIWSYYGAYRDGTLNVTTGIMSVAIGAALMACPILMLKLRLHPYFKQQ